MPQYRALHTKLKLNNKQKSLLAQHPGAARFTWNWALEICNAALPTGKCSPSAIDLHNRLAAKAPIGRVLVLQSPQRFGSISGAEYPERFPKMG
jgi:hypothetical protein